MEELAETGVGLEEGGAAGEGAGFSLEGAEVVVDVKAPVVLVVAAWMLSHGRSGAGDHDLVGVDSHLNVGAHQGVGHGVVVVIDADGGVFVHVVGCNPAGIELWHWRKEARPLLLEGLGGDGTVVDGLPV